MARRDNLRAAQVLVEAEYDTDAKVARRWGITARSIENYRAALEKDEELSAMYAEMLKVSRIGRWQQELNETLSLIIRKVREEFEGKTLSEVDYDNARAALGIHGTLAETEFTRVQLANLDAYSQEDTAKAKATTTQNRPEGESPAVWN